MVYLASFLEHSEIQRISIRKMGRRRGKSYTLPSSPSSHSFSSSSSSDFEFTISISPRKSSTSLFCPADELFYKGQLLPLHLSPRISMVRTLLLSSSTSSSSTTNTTSRDSTDSHSSFNSDLALFPDYDSSSRPSSVTDFDDDFKRRDHLNPTKPKTTNKYFSLSRFSSVFRNNNIANNNNVKTRDSVKRMSATAKEVIRKYFKKVKPLYEKFSQKQKTGEFAMEEVTTTATTASSLRSGTVLSLLTRSNKEKSGRKENNGVLSHSFSGNLRYPRSRRSCVSSCPSSMRSSPSHSGVLSFPGAGGGGGGGGGRDASSMEELQSAIQGAISHCKNSLIQNQIRQ